MATQDATQRFRVMIGHLHGAVKRVPSGEMAFPLRESGHELEVTVDWGTPAEEATAVRWAKALCATLQPFSRGMYGNGLGEPNDELMKAAYGPNYARLARIKKRYDPTNVLGLDPSIKPA
jgi:hypothetical protein